MPNYDVNSMTPGSAVADTLQELLTRRKAEARQAMLDQIAEQQRRADENYRAEQLKIQQAVNARDEAAAARAVNEEARRAQEFTLNQQINQDNLFGQRLGRLRGGTDLSEIPDTDFRNRIVREGLAENIQPFGPTEEGGTPAPRQLYRGSPDFQQEQEERQRLIDFRDTVDPQQNPELLQVIDALIGGASGIPTELLGAPPETFTVAADGTITRSPIRMGRNANVIQLPQVPRSEQDQLWQITYPNGDTQSHYGKGDDAVIRNAIAQGAQVRQGNAPTDPVRDPYDPRIVSQLNALPTRPNIRDSARDQAALNIEDSLNASYRGARGMSESNRATVVAIGSNILAEVRRIAQAGRTPPPPLAKIVATLEAENGPMEAGFKTALQNHLTFILRRYGVR